MARSGCLEVNTEPDATHAANQGLIFVIEDDPAVARLVVSALEEFGYATETYHTGTQAMRRLPVKRPDLCIVDLWLPDLDGMDLVRQIANTCTCGVLILTARGHTVDRVMGLELGGDDYMVKPFEPRELVARVRSVLRRRGVGGAAAAVAGRRQARFEGWVFDCTANQLRSAQGDEHLLGLAEAQVLRAFVERPNQILTREQLLGQPDLSPLDRSIDVRISRLRRRLEADPQNPKVIKTVYGAGYLFAAHVTWA
ncbi:MAG: response regulator transcription factor [Thauera aminoaromatica]|uniref:Response regulator transcription factor n=1 Tax=Thauera aminoaromatica TaxID=164330 RepID=A0A5C7SMB9_THASP|nr:MAG: response regulator transcription factor [Thauera aminoaromatica]